MATLQPEKSAPDLEEERASTPLSLTCKEDYANATNCLSESRSTTVDAAVEAGPLVRWVCPCRFTATLANLRYIVTNKNRTNITL